MNIQKGLAGATLVLFMLLVCSLNVLANEPDALEGTGVTTETENHQQVGYINASNVRLRSEADLTAKILITLRRGAKLTILGKEGEWYKVIHNDFIGYVFNEFVTFGEAGRKEMNDGVEMLDWSSEGKSIMKEGTVATITDISTGIQFKIRVLFGTNHADVEPLTADDTAKMKQTRGGKWSWGRRAIWVTLESGRTFAASANGMPHGRSSISNNNFPGHFCIHFLNSRIHGTNKVDAEHQNQIKIAFNAS